jgi:hypothetical protein
VERLNIAWTPDGLHVLRLVNDEVVATATYGSIDEACAGIRILLEAQERAYLFAGKTDSQTDTETLARAIERGMDE